MCTHQGRTRAYTKGGLMVNQFPSMLPGGNRHTCRKGYALLDCIWSKASNTFYVLDLVVWFNQSVMETDVSDYFFLPFSVFKHYEWSHSKVCI